MIFVFQEDGFSRNVKEGPEGARWGATPHGQNELFSFLWKIAGVGQGGVGWAQSDRNDRRLRHRVDGVGNP